MHGEIALNVIREELWLDKLEVYVAWDICYTRIYVAL